MKKKIYIDAGHGGGSIGASYKGRFEQDDTLRLALAVGTLLAVQPGIEVMLSRTTSVNPSINKRCEEANRWKADYFISIHRNASKPEQATGAESWIYSKAEKDGGTYNKAKDILDEMCRASGYKNRGIHKGAPSYTDFGVNRLSDAHSCLLEVGFIDNTDDNLRFDEEFESIAQGIAKGLCKAVGVTYRPFGDLDGDGDVDEADARLAMRYAVGLETANENAMALGDMDGDGKITAADSREILRKAVGLEG